MGERVQEAASQIDMEPGEKISLQFDEDAHYHPGQTSGEKHNDAYAVTRQGDGSHKVTKMHTDDK
jgi:hypothetical protein